MTDQRQCRLCLQFFKNQEELIKIPHCEHIFHIKCLKRWLFDFQKCPVCEMELMNADARLKENQKFSSNAVVPSLMEMTSFHAPVEA